MKIITTLFLGVLGFNCFAQLTVKPNGTEDNFIYVKGEVLYVEEEINLTENSDPGVASIYLRHEGQLIQGRTDASANSGTGVLSVFQEGTVDNYAYNYWGAPVGLADGSGNTPFGIGLLYTPSDTKLSSQTVPIGGYNGVSSNMPTSAAQIAKYWIWRFSGDTGTNGTSEYADWIHVLDANTVLPGEGFTMKGVSGSDGLVVDGVDNNSASNQRYDFRGRPHDGLITIDVAAGQEYLVGNPYPSALDLSYFLLENSTGPNAGSLTPSCTSDGTVTRRNAIEGIAYFWDSDPAVQSHNLVNYKGGYEAFSPVDCSTPGISTPATFVMYNLDGTTVGGSADGDGDARERRYAPIGQGFFVHTPADSNSDVIFRNTHRVFEKETGGFSNFHKLSSPQNATESNASAGTELEVIPKLRLNVEFNGQYTRQLALGFWYTATDGVDAAMDGRNIDGLPSDAGWLHNDENFVIDVRQFDIEQQIPLYLNLNAQKTVKFRVNTSTFENFDVENVYILDKQTQSYHPVKDQTFTITLAAGNYNERFKLTFQNNEETMSVDDVIADAFDIFQNNNAGQLEVRNPKNIEIKSVALYDMTGRQIFGEQNIGTGSIYSFPTANMQEAIYVVKIITSDNKETAKKVSIINRN